MITGETAAPIHLVRDHSADRARSWCGVEELDDMTMTMTPYINTTTCLTCLRLLTVAGYDAAIRRAALFSPSEPDGDVPRAASKDGAK